MDERTRVDLRDAAGVQIGDHTQMHLHVRRTTPPWWIASGYLNQVRDIAPGAGAPGALKDRGAELAELAAFAVGDQDYLWWRAEPWAGKSALLSTFVLHPPPLVEVVSFFVTMRVAARSDSVAFTDMLIDQLSALLGEPAPGSMSPGRADVLRRALLLKAVDKLRAEGRRLVLVVDGIDEDRGVRPGSGLASIASLLPRAGGDGLRVVVSSRPGPPLPADVADDHPLRAARIRNLAMSPHAGEVARHAGQELRDLLHGDGLGREVLGLITACGDGLTVAELEELTGEPPFRLEGLLGGVFGRTVAGREPDRRHVFTHETLRSTAVRSFGASLAGYRDRLHGWADDYRARAWPPDTPQYLLRGYAGLLFDQADADRLAGLALDRARHDRMLVGTGGDAAAFAEMNACQGILLGHAEVTEADLDRLLRLSHHRDELETRNRNIPARLPAVWATLGRAARAEALANSIADPYERSGALVALVEALAMAGDTVRAERIAGDIADPYERVASLAGLAKAVARAGGGQRAIVLADAAAALVADIDNPYEREMASTGLAEVLATAGAVDRAERIALALTDPYQRALALTGVARAVGTDRALRIVRDIAVAEQRAWALIGLVDAAEPGRVAELAGLAEEAAGEIGQAGGEIGQAGGEIGQAGGEIGQAGGEVGQAAGEVGQAGGEVGQAYRRALALAGLAKAVAGKGETPRALALVAAAQRTGRRTSMPYEQALVSAGLAEALAAAGEPERAERLVRDITDPYERALALNRLVAAAAVGVDDAERAARGIPDATWRAQVMTDLAAAVCAAGDPARAAGLAGAAEGMARDITDPSSRAGALADLAVALAVAGEVRQAERVARGIDDRDERERALAGLAEAVAAEGDVPRAERIIELIADPDWRAGALAGLAENLSATGNVERARQIAHGIADPEWRRRALAGAPGAEPSPGDPEDPDVRAQALAAEAAATGDVRRAERLARAIADPGRQARALIVAAAEAPPDAAGRLIAAALALASWRYSARALAVAYPRVLIRAAPTLEATT